MLFESRKKITDISCCTKKADVAGMNIMVIKWNIDFGFRKPLKFVKLCDVNFDSESLP